MGSGGGVCCVSTASTTLEVVVLDFPFSCWRCLLLVGGAAHALRVVVVRIVVVAATLPFRALIVDACCRASNEGRC